jgi:gliding motility-associated lipoprotein GldH
MINKAVSILAVLLLLPLSCQRSVVFDQFSAIDKSGWNWENPLTFEIELNDTVNVYDLFIQVRHSVDYPMSNLYMFVKVSGPSGQSLTDTVNFILAESDGMWLGSGVGKLKELRLLYRKNTLFKDPGTYTFVIEQGMRSPKLPVTDVGIRVEKAH